MQQEIVKSVKPAVVDCEFLLLKLLHVKMNTGTNTKLIGLRFYAPLDTK